MLNILPVVVFPLSLTVLVANISILLVVRRLKTLKKVVTYFVNHLAVADLLYGLSSFARGIIMLVENDNQMLCMLVICPVIMTAGCGVTGVLFLSLESYLSLKNHQTSQQVLQKSIAFTMIAVSWFFWITFALGSIFTRVRDSSAIPEDIACMFGNEYFNDIYVVCLCTVLFAHFICILYFQIGVFVHLRRHFVDLRNSMAARSVMSPGQRVGPRGSLSFHQLQQQRRWFRQRMKLTKLIALVSCLFVICWYPSIFGIFIGTFCDESCTLIGDVLLYLSLLLLVHSFLNAFAYGLKSREFRASLYQLYCVCDRCGRKTTNRVGHNADNLVATRASSESTVPSAREISTHAHSTHHQVRIPSVSVICTTPMMIGIPVAPPTVVMDAQKVSISGNSGDPSVV